MRQPYGMKELGRLIEPTSIAIFGASDRPGSLGLRALNNLDGYAGRVYPISARLSELGGRVYYPSLADLPEAPDCVVLAIPAEAVEPALEQCAAAGAGSAVVFASGFAELATPDAIAAQTRLAELARRTGLRVVGPNTTGLANLATGAHMGFAEFPHGFVNRPGSIAIVAQSGAMGLALSQASEHGASISHVLTCGNSCDVDVADYISCLAESPHAGAIALVFEGLEDFGRLRVAAHTARKAGLTVVGFKLARSSEGSVAAASHTATDTGTAEGFDALAAETGLIPVTDIEHLLETAAFFSKVHALPGMPRAKGPRVAIISSSGGTGILAADTASLFGVALPQPASATRGRLVAALPAFASARNPCDVTAQATSNPQSLQACAEALLSDAAYDALVLPVGRGLKPAQLDALSAAALARGKPLCIVWMSQWLEGPGSREAEALAGLCLFRSMRSCFNALAAWRSRD